MGKDDVASEEEINAFLHPPVKTDTGESIATNDEVDSFLVAGDKKEKYGTFGQQLKTGLEGAASAATFGLSTGIERGLGVDPEDIRGRREENPIAHGAGMLTGLVGTSLIPGLGEANAAKIMGSAGRGGAAMLGLRAEKVGFEAFQAAKAAGLTAAEAKAAASAAVSGFSIPSRIGSAAATAAVDNALFQAGDEVSKMLSSDPSQTFTTALSNVGLSGVIGSIVGGKLSGANELWKAKGAPKLQGVLDAFTKKAGGIEGAIDDHVGLAIDKLGLDIAPEVKAGLSSNPAVQAAFKTLQQSDTTSSGRALQESVSKFRTSLEDALLESMGKTRADIPLELSRHEIGKNLSETVASEVEQRLAPHAKKFEELESKYGNVELPKDTAVDVSVPNPQALIGTGQKVVQETTPGFATKALEKIEQAAEQNKWSSFEDPQITALLNGVRQELPKKNTVSQLTDLISTVGKKANKDFTNRELSRAGEIIKEILQTEKDEFLVSVLGKEAPELVGEFAATKAAWAQEAKLVRALQDRLPVKGSISGFPRLLREVSKSDAETILNRLSGSGDAELLQILQKALPNSAKALQDFHVADLLHRAKTGDRFDASKFIRNINAKSYSPELRSFALSGEALSKTRAIGTILEQLNKAPHNFSNTARTMDKLFEHVPGSAVAIVGLLAGANPVLSGAMGLLTKYVGRDVPDAVRLSMLKYMGSAQSVEATTFRRTVDLIQDTIHGERMIKNGTRAVFKSTREVLPSKITETSERDRERLEKYVDSIEKDPGLLLNSQSDQSNYINGYSLAAGETVGRVVQFLSQAKPKEQQLAPLDAPIKPSKAEMEEYHQVLNIADKPLSILNKVSNFTLLPKDVMALNAMYPDLYNKLKMSLTNEMIDVHSKGELIPYKLKQSLSMFMGEPLDSTLSPAGIMGAQSSFALQKAPSPNQPAPQGGDKSKLSKSTANFRTAEQSREDRRNDS